MKAMGVIFDIKRYAIHDGPGIRTTVFLKGCGLECAWCHNPESQAFERDPLYREGRCAACGACVDVCEGAALSVVENRVLFDGAACTLCAACVDACVRNARELVGREVTAGEVLAEIRKDRVFFDESGGGATFSGGEPLAQGAFLVEMLRACGDEAIHTTVDTSGYAERPVLEEVSGVTDLFLYDLKVIDDTRHQALCGVSNEVILKNLVWLSGTGRPILVRFPFVPGANDDAENLSALGKFVAALPRAHPVDILPFENVGRDKYGRLQRICPLPDTVPPAPDVVNSAVEILQGYGLDVRVRGERR